MSEVSEDVKALVRCKIARLRSDSEAFGPSCYPRYDEVFFEGVEFLNSMTVYEDGYEDG